MSWSLLTLPALLACADKAPSADDTQPAASAPLELPTGDPATIDLGGVCDLSERLGGFVVETYDSYSIVGGQVLDGVVPSAVLEEIERDGDCALMRRNTPFCDPACDAGETCDFDNSCLPYPASQDLGHVTIAGLAADVRMDPVSPGYTYYDTSLPHPAFEPEVLSWLRSEGGAIDALDLYAVGVHPLTLSSTAWAVEAGADLAVGWAPAPDGARSRIVVSLTVDQHGTSPASVICELPDDGAATIPAAMIDGLIGAGVSGYPSASVRRETADAQRVDGGCVDFSLGAPQGVEIDVVGFTPCDGDEDCPPGESCNVPLQICE